MPFVTIDIFPDANETKQKSLWSTFTIFILGDDENEDNDMYDQLEQGAFRRTATTRIKQTHANESLTSIFQPYND